MSASCALTTRGAHFFTALVLIASGVLLNGCSRSHVVLTIEDPLGFATAAEFVTYEVASGKKTRVALEGKPWPTSVTLISSQAASTHTVRVEAETSSGLPLARGAVIINFKQGVTGLATVTLLAVCERPGYNAAQCALGEQSTGTGEPGTVTSGICLRGACLVSQCGDGIVASTAGETCDDGELLLCAEASLSLESADCRAKFNANDGCDACTRPSWSASIIAGLGEGAGMPTTVALGHPVSLAFDHAGTMYVAAGNSSIIWRVSSADNMATVYVDRWPCRFEDCPRATESAFISGVGDLATDGHRNLYFAATSANGGVVWRVGHQDGTIERFAGGGLAEVGASIAPLTFIGEVAALAVDSLGNLYIADRLLAGVIRVFPETLRTERIAGTGIACLSPSECSDDGDALSAMRGPSSLAVGHDGDLYVIDSSLQAGTTVLRIAPDNRTREVLASTDSGCDSAQGVACLGPAQDITPVAILAESDGSLLLADGTSGQLLRLPPDGSDPLIVAGSGIRGESPDGTMAIAAAFNRISAMARSPEGLLHVADQRNNRVKSIAPATSPAVEMGVVTSVLGNGRLGFIGDGGLATAARLVLPSGLTLDGTRLLVADAINSLVREIDVTDPTNTEATIHTAMGTGTECVTMAADCGTGGLANDAALGGPTDVAMDTAGNMYVAERTLGRIRRADALSGIVSEVATTANWRIPAAVFSVSDGLLVADLGWHSVFKVLYDDASPPEAWERELLVGCASPNPDCGVGGYARNTPLVAPSAIAVSDTGQLYVADAEQHLVFKIDTTISSSPSLWPMQIVAGTGTPCVTLPGPGAQLCGNTFPPSCIAGGRDATAVHLSSPSDIALSSDGLLYIADNGSGRIAEVDLNASPSALKWIAGTGPCDPSGDGGPAVNATFPDVRAVAVTPEGGIFIAHSRPGTVRYIGTDGIITPVAGLVDPRNVGALPAAGISGPRAVARLDAGRWLVTDGLNDRVLLLDTGKASIRAVAGYQGGFTTDGAAARYSQITASPWGIVVTPERDKAYMADRAANKIRFIDLTSTPWTLSTLSGSERGYANGRIAHAKFSAPTGLALADHVLYIADSENHVIRAIDLDTGMVTTVAGTPLTQGFSDDVPGLLTRPMAVLAPEEGGLFIADTGNHRVRRWRDGEALQTIIGNGLPGSGGEGTPARLFQVDSPSDLKQDPWGNLIITSRDSLRLVSSGADGMVTGDDEVLTLYGRPPRDDSPEALTRCLTAVAVAQDDELLVFDACAGLTVRLTRTAEPSHTLNFK